MTLNTFYFLVQQTMFYSIPLLIVAIGGMYSERSGVVNIALEGIMVIGAFVSLYFMNQMQSTMSGQSLLILSMLVAAVTGMFLSLFHAYASINMKANQVISGTALNLFAPAFAIFTARMLIGVQQVTFNNTYRIPLVPFLSDIPVLGDLFFKNTYITTFVGFGILIIATFVLYKTRFGLRLRACGEHPQAADAAGVNVKKMRYIGVLISGALAGLGGLVLMVPVTTAFDGQVGGYGFLALAVLIFGQWRPGRILFAAFFFGLMKTISAAYTGIPILLALGIPSYMFKMIPYLATIIILTFTSKKSAAPRAAGEPYDAGKR
ncbi:MAG: ABC transporter permease [Erysipelotrichaceae bacterium]|nr:ABC transporter permease [Erysipelotrichaceae bacterium]